MAAKKNENVTVENEVVVDAKAEVVENTTANEVAEVAAEPEKKVGFIKAWANNQKEEFKAHPVKKTLKTAGEAAVAVLTIIGAKTVFKAVTSNADTVSDFIDVAEDAVDIVDDVTE